MFNRIMGITWLPITILSRLFALQGVIVERKFKKLRKWWKLKFNFLCGNLFLPHRQKSLNCPVKVITDRQQSKALNCSKETLAHFQFQWRANLLHFYLILINMSANLQPKPIHWIILIWSELMLPESLTKLPQLRIINPTRVTKQREFIIISSFILPFPDPHETRPYLLQNNGLPHAARRGVFDVTATGGSDVSDDKRRWVG